MINIYVCRCKSASPLPDLKGSGVKQNKRYNNFELHRSICRNDNKVKASATNILGIIKSYQC